MNPGVIAIILALIDAANKFGPDAIQAGIAALNKDEITLEDIQGLKITKEPEEY